MKRSSFFVGVLAFGVFGAIVVPGCASFQATICEYGICTEGDGAAGDANRDGSIDAEPPPTGCDTPTEPGKDPVDCLVDKFGVFVSPTGDDGNDGTKAKPFKTIEKALGAMRPRIVVCEGTYAEVLDIQRDAEIYGGVDCTFSKEGGKAKIAPALTTGLTLSSGVVKLYDIEVASQSATAPGASSIGIFAKAGTLELTRSKVSAGAGADGAPAAATGDNLADVDLTGNPSTGSSGAASKVCTCKLLTAITGTSTGAAGGNGGIDNTLRPGSPGGSGLSTPVIPSPAEPYTGAGGAGEATSGGGCGTGKRGAPGSAKSAGNGASRIGIAAISGWRPEPGGQGDTGNPGQGGGGGGGGYFNAGSAGGGGGGCGGCGGAGASGGGGGGSSIAILALDAKVSTVQSSVGASTGGKGQTGGTGQAGGGGGGGTVGACSGGGGGPGAGGGGGGGGAGGASISIAFTSEPPTVDGQAKVDEAALPGFSFGAAGARGLGGPGGDPYTASTPNGAPGLKGGDGAPGVAKAIMKVER